MQKMISIAVTLLVIQIGLAVLFYKGEPTQKTTAPDTPFLGMKSDQVSSFEITGPQKERLVVEKIGTEWIIKDSFGAPANGEQVKAFITKLSELKKGFAVATTTGAAKRFKVADDQFERHVVLREKEQIVGEFYVGTSPGFRQIHVRKAGTEEVLAVALSTFELETGVEAWLDKNLFKIKIEDMASISFPGFVLEKKAGTWQLQELESGWKTDEKNVTDLLNKVADLTIQAVMNPQETTALFAKAPAFKYSVTRGDGTTAEFSFVKQEGNSYVLKQSERELYGKVNSLQVEGLQKITRDALLQKETTEKPEEADTNTK
jgi:hypothetical protein